MSFTYVRDIENYYAEQVIEYGLDTYSCSLEDSKFKLSKLSGLVKVGCSDSVDIVNGSAQILQQTFTG